MIAELFGLDEHRPVSRTWSFLGDSFGFNTTKIYIDKSVQISDLDPSSGSKGAIKFPARSIGRESEKEQDTERNRLDCFASVRGSDTYITTVLEYFVQERSFYNQSFTPAAPTADSVF